MNWPVELLAALRAVGDLAGWTSFGGIRGAARRAELAAGQDSLAEDSLDDVVIGGRTRAERDFGEGLKEVN